MPCSGCGGKGHSPGDTYGHILGCGAKEFMEDDRYNPLKKEEQEVILRNAVEVALNKVKEPRNAVEEFARELAQALYLELEGRCVEKRLYT